VILVDVNLLLYAVNRDSPPHAAAKAWFENVMSGSTAIGLPWVVLLAFLRLTTSTRIFERPLSVEQAAGYIDHWLRQPVVTIPVPGPQHWPILRNLLEQAGTGGNLTTDAHIATLALEHGYTVHSSDYDFKRFAGLKHVNPLDR
jgi:toxin-antitoxin system PIN domain toxin